MSYFSRLFFTFWFLLLFLSLFVSPGFSGEALDFVKGTIDQLETLRKELVSDYTTKKRKETKAKALKIAFGVIDIKEISKLALGKHYNKISSKQRKEFESLFYNIISNKIVHANLPKSKAKIKNKKAPVKLLSDEEKSDKVFKKKAFVVKSEAKIKKILYEIDIYLFKKSGKFWLYDVHIDQASTLLDFKNQFAKIIRKKGFRHLLKKLRAQVKKNKVKK